MALDRGPRDLLALPEHPFRLLTHPVGMVLQSRERPIEAIWLVRGGRVLLHGQTDDGTPVACSSRGAGAVIGLEALNGLQPQRDAVVVREARLAVAPVDAVRRWMGAREVARTLVHVAVDELATCTAERTVAVGSSRTRLARFLMARDRDPCMAAWENAPMSDVACLLGLRPETVSRALADLMRRGIVSDGREITIADVDALDEIAGG